MERRNAMKYYGTNEWENRAREAEYNVSGLKTELERARSEVATMRDMANMYMKETMGLDRFYVERVRLLHERNQRLTYQLMELEAVEKDFVALRSSLQAEIDTLKNEKEKRDDK
tara:strand:- start:7323 stop:7664 length:342 start_codon:yes stop_codon:yes gene_type:complete